MELLERYLQAVGQYLPAKGKADTLAELRANLLGEMEGREEELGRPLTQAEVVAVLEEHGRPMLVAARYMPQQYLIGPGLFPIYWFTLKRSFPFVLLAYLATQMVWLITQAGAGLDVGAMVGRLPRILFYFWGVMTLGFAFFEFAQGRFIGEIKIPKKWDPTELAMLDREEKRPLTAHAMADLIVSLLAVVWLLMVPYKPYLLIGPGAAMLHGMPFGLSPEWHIFYWQIMGLLIAMLPLKAALLFRAGQRWRKAINVATQAIGILVIVVLIQTRTYIVPAATLAGTQNWKTVESMLAGINVGFKLVLVISMLKLLWDIWKMITDSHTPKEQVAR
jgi:hypothetical protein